MTDDDKCFEAFRVTDMLADIIEDVRPTVDERFSKGTRFPYFQRYQTEDDKRNTWTLIFHCPSKEARRKHAYYTYCYTIYEVPPKRKLNDTNAGKGIIMFDPTAMRNARDGKKCFAAIVDIVPHAFNRYTMRYLKPKGIDNMQFEKKIENMVSRFMHFDVAADMFGDDSAIKHKEKDAYPYDIIMRGGGMLRGQLVNGGMLLRFFTYVSEDMYYDAQVERQAEMVREHFRWKQKGMKL